ncbi:oligosaccharide flippase family protein [Solwaraspora sp. WMMD791]|uniref:oligosaccharide flippase family protein n=1 Tax=Solwaraspora sp. WMMD791 TaxID=3016086 RepID=UPI00249C6BFD|nr:oligosaccharide flippase family protein [Solwaraspora sp. WMMD791]WFE30195.1 oligosaccharide flippase family protein [Solwaraspora sp. WMMD791]
MAEATTPTAELAGLGGRVRRALAWSAFNNIAIRLGSFGVSIMLARLLAPSEFGVYAVALTVQTIVVAFAELGLSADLIRKGNIAERAGTATTVATASSALLAVAMCLLAGPIAMAMGSPEATSVVQVMSVTLILSGFSVVPYAVLQREFRQSAQMSVDGLSLVLNAIVTVLLILLGFGAMALAIARVVSQAGACALQFRLARVWPRFGFDRTMAIGLVRFGLPLASANVVSWAVLTVDYMIVGSALGAVLLGFYVMAFNISSWPMGALGAAVRAVALPAFARLTDPSPRAAALHAAVALSWSGALLAGVLLSGLATVLIPLVYGARWLPAAAALVGLGLFGAVRVVTDLLSSFLIAVGAPRTVLWAQLSWLVALVPAMVVGVRYWGIAGAGWAHLVVALVVVLPLHLALVRPYAVRTGVVLGHLLVPVLAVLPAAVVGIGVSGLFDNRLLALLVGGMLTTVLFVAPLARWLPRRFRELRGSTAGPPPESADPDNGEPVLVAGPAGAGHRTS